MDTMQSIIMLYLNAGYINSSFASVTMITLRLFIIHLACWDSQRQQKFTQVVGWVGPAKLNIHREMEIHFFDNYPCAIPIKVNL